MTNLYDSFARPDSPATENGRLSSHSGGSISSPGLSSNGDSADSLRSPSSNRAPANGIIRAMPAITRHSSSSTTSNHNNNNNSSKPQKAISRDAATRAASPPPPPATGHKSPILIKYNYYDYNGTRQEQVNATNEQQQVINNNNNKIQRQLSPTFKQSLDLIVKNSQQLQLAAQQQQQQPASGLSNHQMAVQRRSASESPEWLTGSSSGSAESSPHLSCHAQQPPQPPQQHPIIGPQFSRRYKMSSYEQRCLRCQKTVYQMDKVGPLKDFTFYHQNCFKCLECGTKLTLKTYFNNQQISLDQEVYCHRHCPKTGPGKLDNQSVGIRAALNAPKVFEQQLSCSQQQPLVSYSNSNSNSNPNCDYITPNIINNGNSAAAAAAAMVMNGGARVCGPHVDGAPSVDSRALHIQHAVSQTKLQGLYKNQQQSPLNQRLSQFINMRLEYLEPKQKMLEMRHREEEDALFKAFEAKWRLEESSITEQIRSEWQGELEKLLDKYKRQLSSISASEATKLVNEAASKLMMSSSSSSLQSISRTTQAPAGNQLEEKQQAASEQLMQKKMIEYERMNLEATMTIKLDRKKETLKRKLKEFERQATAELVEKQSKEMLALISLKLGEFKEEQKRKIGSDLDQFEAIESLANQFESSFRSLTDIDHQQPASKQNPSIKSQKHQQHPKNHSNSSSNNANPATASNINNKRAAPPSALFPGEIRAPPPPGPSQALPKVELYNSDRPEEAFGHIDQMAISVAREDQQSFTDLVHHLTRNCLNDVEKVRAIFRWITVKNLNTMHFDSSVKPDTPLGLLRGIKNGSESYHVLFKRLCSYAGLHCVVIKGYSKSAGYQPGLRFEGSRFRNSWNAVYVAGAWRFVQCNWGARHLVSVAVQDKYKDAASNGSNGAKMSSPKGSKATPSSQQGVGPSAPINQHQSAQLPAVNKQHHQQHHRHQQSSMGASDAGRGSVPANLNPITSKSNHKLRQQQQAKVGPQVELNGHAGPISPMPNHGRRGLLVPAGSSLIGGPVSPNNINNSTVSTSSSFASAGSSDLSGASLSSGDLSQLGSPTYVNQHPAPAGSSPSDNLRYEYDDHYFLTDPDEFIHEFFPHSSEWQLIRPRPITLAEFEQLPFVRSLFFRYGLYFPQPHIRSVLLADSSGATTIKIGMPTHLIPNLIFHYNLRYYDSDEEYFEGISLKRFVMQSIENGSNESGGLLSNVVSFRVHLPESGSFILDIFANSITPNQYISGEPMRFKSVCKFKIVAKNLKTVMIPLPDCASGEFGPMKATRLFGIIPLTHEASLISVKPNGPDGVYHLEIQFRMTRPLVDFMATLHKNGYDERQLSRLCKIFIEGDIITISIRFFEEGQYGLDIYTRDRLVLDRSSEDNNEVSKSNDKKPSSTSASKQKQLLTHCCKYLINVKSQ